MTIALANGRSESWIADRTGFLSSMMIARYKHTARTFKELSTGELSPLAEAIPELRDCPGIAPSGVQLSVIIGDPNGTRTQTAGLQGAETIENRGVADPRDRASHDIASAEGQSGGNQDPVEVALAEALTRAAAAQQWDVVQALTAELQARRQARAGAVDLDAERAKRRR